MIFLFLGSIFFLLGLLLLFGLFLFLSLYLCLHFGRDGIGVEVAALAKIGVLCTEELIDFGVVLGLDELFDFISAL